MPRLRLQRVITCENAALEKGGKRQGETENSKKTTLWVYRERRKKAI